jgi:hypothetical protein
VVALAGSGDANTAGKKPSTVTLKSPKGEVTLKRPGFYVEIGADGAITQPSQLTEEVERSFANLLPAISSDLAATDRRRGPDARAIIAASGQPAQEGRPLARDQRDFQLADHLDGRNTFEATSNLPVQEVSYSTGLAPITFVGASGGGNYGIDYTLNLAERSFEGSLTLNCATCASGIFTTSIPLLVSPFENGFQLAESGFVLDPTAANDTFNVHYAIGPNNIGAVVQYDADGPGGLLPSTGTGVAPVVP